jgi:hypothetical protein
MIGSPGMLVSQPPRSPMNFVHTLVGSLAGVEGPALLHIEAEAVVAH